MEKKSKVTVKELRKWQDDTMDLLNGIDSLVIKMKVELKRQRPRLELLEQHLTEMEKYL